MLLFSEFGRRITENGSQGTDRGATGMMMAMGGLVRGGLYGAAAKLRQDAADPDLENAAGDVRRETDSAPSTPGARQLARRQLGSIFGADFRPAPRRFSGSTGRPEMRDCPIVPLIYS